MTPEPTCELLRRCGRECSADPVAGPNAGAWDELVERFGPLLRGWVRYFLYLESGALADPSEVEELVQEIYCRLLDDGGRRLRRFRGRHPGQAHQYLRRVAGTLVQDHLRRVRALKRRCEQRRRRPALGDLPFAEQVLDPANDPETRLLFREQLEQLFDCCRRLAVGGFRARNLRILHLALVEGFSSREIACDLGEGMSASAVDTVIHRMRRKLAHHGLHLASRCHGRVSA